MTVDQRPGDDGAEPCHREGAIYRQSRPRQIALGGDPLNHRLDSGHQLRQSLTGVRRDRQDLRALQRCALECVLDIRGHQLDPIVVNQVSFGQRDQSARNSEQVQNGQVLSCLRHDRLVRGDDQQREIDASDTGEHVVDEALVSGNVHNGDIIARGQLQPREAEVNRQPTLLLLGEPIRVDPGKRLHEG